MSTSNETVARRMFDQIFNAGDLSVLDELAHPDIEIRYGDGSTVHGTAAYRETFTQSHQAFPDECFTVEDLFGSGDRVAVRWRWEATHQGEYAGIEPTGRAVSATGVSIYRIVEGRVVEAWMESAADLQAQLA